MIIKRLPRKLHTISGICDTGSIIKTMREDCGLSQIELAKEIGLNSAAAISLYESNDRKISYHRMNEIRWVCGLEIIKK